MKDDKSIEEILMQDERFKAHFVRKHSPKYSTVPEVDFSYFQDNADIKKSIDSLRAYLIDDPLIEDNFPLGVPDEDAPRDDWLEHLWRKYGDEANSYLFNNKLRGNHTGHGLLSLTSALVACLARENQELIKRREELKELISSMGASYKDYEKMNIGQRIDLVRKIEDTVYHIFETIALK